MYFITSTSVQPSYPKRFPAPPKKVQFGVETPSPTEEFINGIPVTVSGYPVFGPPETPSPPSPLLTQEGRRQDRHHEEAHIAALRAQLQADIERERAEGRATRANFRQQAEAQELQNRVLQRTYAGVRARRLESHRREQGRWQTTVNNRRHQVHQTEGRVGRYQTAITANYDEIRRLEALLAQERSRLEANQQGIAYQNEALTTQREDLTQARDSRDFYQNEVRALERNPQSIGTRAISEEPPEEGQVFNYHDRQNAAFYNNAYREVHGNNGFIEQFGDEAYVQAFGADAYRRAFGNRAYVRVFGFDAQRAAGVASAMGRRTPRPDSRSNNHRTEANAGRNTAQGVTGPFAPPPINTQPVRVNTEPVTRHAETFVHRPVARAATHSGGTGQASGSGTRPASPVSDGDEGGGATVREIRPPRTSTNRSRQQAGTSTPRPSSRQQQRRQSISLIDALASSIAKKK